MEQRPCPHCGREMLSRLGEWECQTCGSTAPGKYSAIRDQIERRQAQQSALPQYATASAPPPPRDVPGVFQSDYDEYGRYQPRYAMSGEKGLLFWTAVAVNAVPILGIAGTMIWLDSMLRGMGGGSGSGTGSIWALVWVLLLVTAVWNSFELWVLWHLLHSNKAWMRYGCGCGTILRLLGAVAGLFGASRQETMAELAMLGSWATPVYALVLILWLVFNAWLLSVIVRDLRNMGKL